MNESAAMCVIGDYMISQLRDMEKVGQLSFRWDVAAIPHPEGSEANVTWGTANTAVSYTHLPWRLDCGKWRTGSETSQER